MMKEDWINDMRRKLENHQMDPPPGLWDDICKQMGLSPEPVRKPTTNKRLYWTVAAAVLALVGFFVFQNGNDSEQPQQANAVSQQPLSEQQLPEKPVSQPLAESNPVEQEPQTKAPLLALARHQQPVAESETVTEEVLPESDSPAEVLQTPDEPKQAVDESQQMISESQQSSVEPQQTANLAQKAEWLENLPIAESNDVQTQNKWSLGLNASGGLLAANTSQRTDRLYHPSSMYDDINRFDGNQSQNEVGDKSYAYTLTEYKSEHHLPIRFGVSLNYQLTPRIALHSGISYTYLYSEFSIPLYESATFDQKLHYLGIPLGVSWQLWSTHHFQFYLSGAMMLEKCVSADVDGGSASKKPWQWSVSAAAGAEYNFIPQLGFYLEPSLGYYFDDGTSLEHYYKKHPLAPTIEFGLRLHLNE